MPRRTQKQQPSTAVVSTQPKFTKEKFRKFLLGSKEKEGFLKVFVIYALLICIGFIYIYPILYMVSQSFMTLDDLLDSSINWIPSKLNLDNYKQAAQSMEFWKSFGQSIIIAGVPTLCNLLSCSVIGYGLARFEFPGKKVVLGIILFTFILPSQITLFLFRNQRVYPRFQKLFQSKLTFLQFPISSATRGQRSDDLTRTYQVLLYTSR